MCGRLYLTAYYGFKLSEELKDGKDLFSVGFVNKSGRVDSDDNDFLVDWNYKTQVYFLSTPN
jgi:hypothetical protein